ncbi:MAG TPA: hypothetical protein VHW00_08880 [Thermoanaerobaculia bacterium]|nr:hypothetical protein [Thermoanaerobaculia bacterium]
MFGLAALLLQLATMQPDVIHDPVVRGFSRELLARARAERFAEQGAFVARASDGTLYFIVWPPGPERDILRWRGRIPPGTIAILHTHPPASPAASKIDERAARSSRIPVYVITNGGIARTLGEGSEMIVSGDWSSR